MAVFVEVFGAFCLTISESKTESVCMPIPHAPAAQILFNATGPDQHRQTTSFTNYLRGAVTETPNLSDEIGRRIRAGWMSFRCYTRELYDRPKASILHLKTQMVKFEVVEALLYECETCIPLTGHYHKFRPHSTGCRFKS